MKFPNEDLNDPNSIFQRINRVFEYMPLAALIEDKILAVSGGKGLKLIKRNRNVNESHVGSGACVEALRSEP